MDVTAWASYSIIVWVVYFIGVSFRFHRSMSVTSIAMHLRALGLPLVPPAAQTSIWPFCGQPSSGSVRANA